MTRASFNWSSRMRACARAQGQKEIVTTASGNQMIDAANKVMADALTLGPMLQAASGAANLATQFPANPLGNQLKEVAHMISLRSQLNVSRRVFFCSLGGFGLHNGESWNHFDLLTFGRAVRRDARQVVRRDRR